MAQFFASGTATDGTDVPWNSAKEVARRLGVDSDVKGDVKLGDIVLGSQLKIIAPEKAAAVVDVTADFPFQGKLVNAFQPFGPGQVQAAAITALKLDGLDLGDPLMAWKVAGSLLRADRSKMTAFLVALTGAYLDRSACPGGVPALALYVWPFSWVPAKAREKLASVPKRPPDKRGVALNSDNHETALAYLRCAPLQQDMLKRVAVGPPAGEESIAELKQRVERQDRRGGRLPARPAPGVPPSAVGGSSSWSPVGDRPRRVTRLRNTFSAATFVVLAGPPTQSATFQDQGLAAIGVEYLEPALPFGLEAAVRDHFDRVEDRITNTCDGLPGGSP